MDGLSEVGAKLLANALTQKLECCLPINLLERTVIQRQTKEILRQGSLLFSKFEFSIKPDLRGLSFS